MTASLWIWWDLMSPSKISMAIFWVASKLRDPPSAVICSDILASLDSTINLSVTPPASKASRAINAMKILEPSKTPEPLDIETKYTWKTVQWLLALSELALLAVLHWRREEIRLPAFRLFLAFSIISALSYDPWNVQLFMWMSLASVALRCAVFTELFYLLVRGKHEGLRSLILAASAIVGLAVLSVTWVLAREYAPAIELAIYCTVVLAGAVTGMLVTVWLTIGLPEDWRRVHAFGLTGYFVSLAIARVSAEHWQCVNYMAMLEYSAILCWLALKLFRYFPEKHNYRYGPCDN